MQETRYMEARGIMATRANGPRTDAIRIVPLHSAAEPAVAAPHLTYRNGSLISAVEVYTIFWGAAWQQTPQSGLINQLNQFYDAILTSAVIDQLAEYSTAGHVITHGQRTGTLTMTMPAPGQSVSDSTIQQTLQQEISKKAVPPATPNTLYFIYLPPGVRVVLGGSASCQAFCGYHSDIGGKTFYGVMPYPGCNGCTGGLSVFDALTSTSSHELCEAITDPVPGQGWYDDVNGEIGDICAWQTKKIGQYTVQLEWSNKAGRCI